MKLNTFQRLCDFMPYTHAQLLENTQKKAETEVPSKKLGEMMLNELFEMMPESQQFFEGIVVDEFASRKFHLVGEHIMDSLTHPDNAQYTMLSEIHRHKYNNIEDMEYYYVLIDCYLAVLKKAIREDISREQQETWNEIALAAKHTVHEAAKELSSL